MTRLLILSDIHNQNITLKEILSKIEKLGRIPDCCLIAGDITNFGTAEDMQNMLNLVLDKIPKTFYVTGNCDPIVDQEDLETLAINVEAQTYEINNFLVIGFGTHRPQLDQKKLRTLRKTNMKVCLLTHVPPFGTSVDVVSINRHVGSRQLRDFIEKNENIFLSICGHIHDSPSISQLGSCTIINPGPVTTGNFAIIDVQKDLKIDGKIFNIYELKT